jgi:superkiller protein 3
LLKKGGISSDELISKTEADFVYADRTYKELSGGASQHGGAKTLSAPHFALSRYLACAPTDDTALHLHALFSERMGLLEEAEDSLISATSVLEQLYEKEETEVVERRYVIASLSLGRVRLARGDGAGAVAAHESALSLLQRSEDAPSTRLRVRGLLCAGLAHFFSGDLERSLETFQEAQESLDAAAEAGVAVKSELRAQLALLLAQVLWSLGGEEQREEAKSQLLNW